MSVQNSDNSNSKKVFDWLYLKNYVYSKKNLNPYVGHINISMHFFSFCNILNIFKDILNTIEITIFSKFF